MHLQNTPIIPTYVFSQAPYLGILNARSAIVNSVFDRSGLSFQVTSSKKKKNEGIKEERKLVCLCH